MGNLTAAYIALPNALEWKQIARNFNNMCGLPQCINFAY